MYLVDLQIGWNPGAYKTSVKATSEAQLQTQPKETPQTSLTSASNIEVTQPVLRDIVYSAIASPGTIKFSSAKFTVNKKDRKHLEKVALILNKNKDLLEKVEVIGHADGSGNTEANHKLSMARAEQVKRILEQSGLKNVPVIATAKGSTEASAHTIRAERRAELVFIGVKDEEALKNALATIE
jgi:outer membrane protein OmpA-like peptidoglycan-associated protein